MDYSFRSPVGAAFGRTIALRASSLANSCETLASVRCVIVENVRRRKLLWYQFDAAIVARPSVAGITGNRRQQAGCGCAGIAAPHPGASGSQGALERALGMDAATSVGDQNVCGVRSVARLQLRVAPSLSRCTRRSP